MPGLKIDLQSKLELPRIERGGWLARLAGAQRVAQRIHIANVEPIEKVESISDEFHVYSLSEEDLARNHA